MGKADFEKADEYKKLVLKRTGLKPSQLVCPREKSEMTPCVARDGKMAAAEAMDFEYGVCVGCDQSIKRLLEKELEKQNG